MRGPTSESREMGAAAAIGLVARREFVERVRQKSFVISTLVLVGVLVAITLMPVLFGFDDPEQYDVGLVGAVPPELTERLSTQAEMAGAEIDTTMLASEEAAREALQAEGDAGVDIAILEGGRLLAQSEPPGELQRLVQAASAATRVADRLESAGLGADEVASVLNPPPLPLDTLEPAPEGGTAEAGSVAFVAAFLLYGQILGYGFAVSAGVVEEKATRIVEILLSSLRPSHLLAGKVIGIGLLGLVQLLLLVGLGLLMVVVSGAVALPPGTAGAVAVVLFWFLLGYAFYSCAFAVAGALVSRQEEIQNTTAPLMLTVLVSFFIAIAALNDPGSTLATVASFLPPVAPLVMPVRVVLGDASIAAVGLSAAATAAAAVALVVLAARVYAGAILRTGGRVRISDAWRGADQAAR